MQKYIKPQPPYNLKVSIKDASNNLGDYFISWDFFGKKSGLLLEISTNDSFLDPQSYTLGPSVHSHTYSTDEYNGKRWVRMKSIGGKHYEDSEWSEVVEFSTIYRPNTPSIYQFQNPDSSEAILDFSENDSTKQTLSIFATNVNFNCYFLFEVKNFLTGETSEHKVKSSNLDYVEFSNEYDYGHVYSVRSKILSDSNFNQDSFWSNKIWIRSKLKIKDIYIDKKASDRKDLKLNFEIEDCINLDKVLFKIQVLNDSNGEIVFEKDSNKAHFPLSLSMLNKNTVYKIVLSSYGCYELYFSQFSKKFTLEKRKGLIWV